MIYVHGKTLGDMVWQQPIERARESVRERTYVCRRLTWVYGVINQVVLTDPSRCCGTLTCVGWYLLAFLQLVQSRLVKTV